MSELLTGMKKSLAKYDSGESAFAFNKALEKMAEAAQILDSKGFSKEADLIDGYLGKFHKTEEVSCS